MKTNTLFHLQRLYLLSMALAFALCIGQETGAHAQKRKQVTIGIVSDGAFNGGKVMTELIKTQVSELAASQYEIVFPDDKHIAGNFDEKSIAAGLDTLQSDPSVTLIFALGPLASHIAGRRERLSKPVIAPFIIDYKLQGLPYKKGKSGRKNLNYLSWPWSVERDLTVFKEVAAPKKVLFLASAYFLKSAPELAGRATAVAKEVGFDMRTVAVDTLASALAAVTDDIDGVYLSALPQLKPGDFAKLVAELNAKEIPTFALGGYGAVERGVLVVRRPKESVAKIARRVALHTMRILGGENASNLSVALKLPERVIINMKTARTIGLSPSWTVLTEAELINIERDDIGRKVSLVKVINEALDGNVDIKALEQVVAAGRANVRKARSRLLPQIEVASSSRLIDSDRAEAGFGNAPEVLSNAELTLTQLLFSESALAGHTAEKHVQASRDQQLVQTKWDVAAEVGVAYLGVLRAKTAERIRRDNLKLTRANLELARIRLDVGSANRSDVYRWEVQIANERKAVVEASSQRNVAELDLQRILNRPPEEQFATEETGLPSAAQNELLQFLGAPGTFRLFREFMAEEAVARSPEIKQLDAAIRAQKRVLTSAERSLYSPTVALQGGANQRLYRGGAGSDSPAGSSANGLEWFVGLNISLPLYSGGERLAEIDRNGAEVARLEQERTSIRNQIVQRAASHLHLAGASYAGISLSRDAAEAAKKNYALVENSYSAGAVDILNLLDAQNSSVNADQVAADSVYDFMIDWINVQRAVGQFQMLMAPAEKKELANRAKAYIEKQKAARRAGKNQ